MNIGLWLKSLAGSAGRLALCVLILAAGAPMALGQSDLWVSAYYAGWMQDYLPPGAIDYQAVTHVIHFAVVPRADGTLDADVNCLSTANSSEAVIAAHAAGRKILVSIGGWGTEAAFLSATNATNRSRFVDHLVQFMLSRDYDGLDIDWEPVSATSASQYRLFIHELRIVLDSLQPRPLLTAAVTWQPTLFADLQGYFDQINVMTYAMSGAWPGWVTWHNAPLYDGGFLFPNTNQLVPSADRELHKFLDAGVSPEKLGIGIHFYGRDWSGGTGTPTGGATEPRQSWTTAPVVKSLPYYQLITTYYDPGYYRWDEVARAAYLSIDRVGSADDHFISYDDELGCREKVEYARDMGLGGVILFELGGGWCPGCLVPDPLLQAVKQSLTPGTALPAPLLQWPANGAGSLPINPTLAWNPVAGATSYTLQLGSEPSFASPLVDRSDLGGTSCTVSGLENSANYYWRVRASDGSLQGDWSDVWRFSTTSDGPLTTTISSFSAVSETGGIRLWWQTSSEYLNKGFDVQRRKLASSSWSVIGWVPGLGTSASGKSYSFLDRKAKKGTTYAYRLRQVQIDGSAVFTKEVTATR